MKYTYITEVRGPKCTECAHFRRGPAGDPVVQCTNADAPLYRASEDMHLATACRLFANAGSSPDKQSAIS